MAKASILVVEDEFVVAEDLRLQLQSQGYHICAIVDTATEAIERVRRETPDLVLMDVLIKGDQDGIEAAKVIQNELLVPVVFITAVADPRLKLLKPFDPCGFLTKPFTTEDLRECVENALQYFAPK